MYYQVSRVLGIALLLVGAEGFAGKSAPRVVLDPGHGGSNLGAPGAHGDVYEKQVTLACARLLGAWLTDHGIDVVFTRTRDEYITLGQRVRLANESGGALFISLHANASPDHRRRGVETFIAARPLIDVQARRAGQVMDPVQATKARAAIRQQARESARLGLTLEWHLGQVRPGDRGVRQAAYDVLDDVAMPAALVEIGFIDHANEGAELLQPEVLEQIAAALGQGVLDFLGR